MSDVARAHEALELLVAEELDRGLPEVALPIVEEIRRRLRDSVAAVIFYGSCLRQNTCEGVLDFYVIVDDYASAHGAGVTALANALYPPSVFYVEVESAKRSDSDADSESDRLRAKYAVMSARDLLRAASPGGLRSGIWARFCQPAVIAYARDEESRKHIHRVAAQSVLTALQCALPLLPEDTGRGDELRFSAEDLWQAAFAETYSNEMRPESADSIRSLYAAGSERYERAVRLGLTVLQREGKLSLLATRGDGGFCVTLPRGARHRRRRRWRARKPLAKLAYAIQLSKTAFTFGDSMVPYALSKVERHSGTRYEPTERQRRHPLIFGWPIVFRILRERALR